MIHHSYGFLWHCYTYNFMESILLWTSLSMSRIQERARLQYLSCFRGIPDPPTPNEEPRPRIRQRPCKSSMPCPRETFSGTKIPRTPELGTFGNLTKSISVHSLLSHLYRQLKITCRSINEHNQLAPDPRPSHPHCPCQIRPQVGRLSYR